MTLTQDNQVSSPLAPGIRPAEKLTTEALVAKFGAQPQTARASYCRSGQWMGLVPIKLPNGRLLWDAAEVETLIAGQPAKTPDPAGIDAHMARKAADKAARLAKMDPVAKAKNLSAARPAATDEVLTTAWRDL